MSLRSTIAYLIGFLFLAFFLFAAFPNPAYSKCITPAKWVNNVKSFSQSNDIEIKIWYNSHDGDVIRHVLYSQQKNFAGVQAVFFTEAKCPLIWGNSGPVRMLELTETMKVTLEKATLVFDSYKSI